MPEEMTNGQKVTIKLHGDEKIYHGVVIKERKMWVELHDYSFGDGNFIADENNIEKWEPDASSS